MGKIKTWVLLVSIFALISCGGGGGSSPTKDETKTVVKEVNLVTGKVIKGPTIGAKVTLYSVNGSGQTQKVAESLTDQSGSFSIPYALNPGAVYLLEAIGGSYIDEISDQVTPLAAPLRALIVAKDGENNFSISAISEAVLSQVEESREINKWSAIQIEKVTAVVAAAFGLKSPQVVNYLDLQSISNQAAGPVDVENFTFSFYAGWFAGFWAELHHRFPSSTLSEGLKQFHDYVVAGSDDDSLNSIGAAGLIRIVGKTPILNTSRYPIYTAIGMPSEATLAAFEGAESSGKSIIAVPNGKLRYIPPNFFASSENTDTFFNSRGALIAHNLDRPGGSGVGFEYIGSASAADVYGDAEIAIGRWNKGYYYDRGVTYDAANKQFITDNANSALVEGRAGKAYAAGVPAFNLPSCGKQIMPLKAKTKKLVASNNNIELILDDSSRLGVQFANGITYVGYDITFTDKQGKKYSFKSVGGAEEPSQEVERNMEFRSQVPLLPAATLPDGGQMNFRGLLAGEGGAKGVISVSTNITSLDTLGLTAAFAADTPLQKCVVPVFNVGGPTPTPLKGGYHFNILYDSAYFYDLDFFSNGTPKQDTFLNLGQDAAVEKAGNDQVGFGIVKPPFTYRGQQIDTYEIYTYRTVPLASSLPATGSATYTLRASTANLKSIPRTLVGVDRTPLANKLTIYFDESPVGIKNESKGSCELFLNINGNAQTILGSFDRLLGSCNGANDLGYFYVGLSGAQNRFAVIKLTKFIPPYRTDAAMLFEQDL
jgi:hypothetical protein